VLANKVICFVGEGGKSIRLGRGLMIDIGCCTSRCPRRDALSRVCYVLGACFTVVVVDFGFWECGLAFSLWESAGREGEAVRGRWLGEIF
jgi:hypothetical protein